MNDFDDWVARRFGYTAMYWRRPVQAALMFAAGLACFVWLLFDLGVL